VPLAEMEYNGFVFDSKQCLENQKLIKEQMREAKLNMYQTKEYDKWKKKYSSKELNVNSPKQLQEFLYTILNYEIKSYSKKGNPSTDKDALDEMNTPFTNLLREYKALAKLHETLAKTYTNETNDDGHLRCSFNLNTVKSYRTSSSDPNLQNVDHHHEISKYALNLMKPLPGHVMLNADFRALEVFGSCCYTHDASMFTYLSDPKTDMHRDIACQLYFYEQADLPKRLRSHTKTLVFSQFYGAGYKSSAKNQWKGLLSEDKERLREHGIASFEAFEAHVKQIIWHFWNVRFKDFYKWRQKNFAFYVKYGYIANHTGFLYTGIMNSRQVSNFPIQGSSAHVLLKLANYMYAFLKKHNMESKLLSTVHDSLMLSAVPNEVPIIYGAIQEFLAQLHEMEPWTVGLDFEVEVEKSEVDGSWFSVKPDVKISGSKIEQLGV
jgi:DNA polymerase-1